MKKFSSEFSHNYKKYSFGYANYCLYEDGDKLSDIYSLGYLPYSGSPDTKKIFYQARSARVPLRTFVMTSENRRIAKKFDGEFKRTTIPIEDFDINKKEFISFCIDYFAKRHGPSVMPSRRLSSILTSGLISDIVLYEKEGSPAAYYFECSDKKMSHFWFSFYDLSLIHQSLGMWLMIDSARCARERGEDYLYIGTVYGEKALYKTAFNNLEYWDGQRWTADVKKLKDLARSDGDRSVDLVDHWKKDLTFF